MIIISYPDDENYQTILVWKYLYRENQDGGRGDMQLNQPNEVYATDENSDYTSGIGSVSLEDLTDGNVK